ncbi:MAG TPA: hypothetical protein VGB18_04525 [Candidatus Thermoplasmatota archaeon]
MKTPDGPACIISRTATLGARVAELRSPSKIGVHGIARPTTEELLPQAAKPL